MVVLGKPEKSAIYKAHVENYLCVDGVVDGAELIETAVAQASRFGAQLFEEDVLGVFFYNQVKGIKITMVKPGHVVSGDIKCADTLGMQQYIPLKDIAIPGCL